MGKRFGRQSRIGRRREISSLLSGGETWQCPQFRVVFRKNNHGHDRVAVLVSKAHGNAVARNRIKRRFREMLRGNDQGGPPYFDILILPQQGQQARGSELRHNYGQWRNSLKQK